MMRRKYARDRKPKHYMSIFLVTVFLLLSICNMDYAGLSSYSAEFTIMNAAVHKYCLQYSKEFKLKELSLDQIEDTVWATIRHESNFKHNSRSWEPKLNCYSYGLMCLVPSTARDMGWKGKYNTELYDIDTNLKYGVKYLCVKLRRYDQRISMAVAAYNAGSVYMDENDEYVNKGYVAIVYFTYYQGLRQHRKAVKS